MSHETPAVRQGERRLARKLAKALRAVGKQIAAKVEKLHKSAEEDERDAVLNADWAPIARAAAAELTDVARDGAQRALTLLLVDDETILDQTFDDAVEWARARAAELVGKSWDEDGELIDNPDADMAITETMRLEIRSRVAQSIADGDSAKELGDSIEELGCFSEARADLIARTEIIRSHCQGALGAMRASGVVEQKAWSTAGEEDVCDDCHENEDEGPIPLEDDFPSGDDAPPGHPACRCAVVAVIGQDDDEESDEDDEDTEEEGADE